MAINDESSKGYPASWSLSAKPYDSCKSASALLFCRADSAFLCFNCDAKVHDIHSANPLARRHERILVVPFYESATSAMKSNVANLLAEAASWLLMETPDLKSGDYFFSDVDLYLDLDYGSSIETRYHHQNSANADSVVPVHTKPPPPPLMNTSDRCFDMGFCRSNVSSSSLDVGVVPDGNSNAVSDITNPFRRKGGVDVGGGESQSRGRRKRSWRPSQGQYN
uniref:B box-type domain-containing protein n=1 Tax=Nelumbo nucifera TaxID=4432 RepID=A0A822YPI2_NELNU|nr:TPA_asm: hypothetical protein HUJ06_006724 [Nelumbo nucifera]